MVKLTPIDTALRFVDRINTRDDEGLSRLMTDDFVFVDYGGSRYPGRDREEKRGTQGSKGLGLAAKAPVGQC